MENISFNKFDFDLTIFQSKELELWDYNSLFFIVSLFHNLSETIPST